MRLSVILAAFLCLMNLPAFAACTGNSYADSLDQTERAALDARVAAMPFAKGLFWEARKDGAVVTVIGTMHINDPRLVPLAEQLRGVVESADLLLLEATAQEEALLQQMMLDDPSILFITDGPTLPEVLDETTWQAVTAAAADRGIPGFVAAKMQPWYLSTMLAIPACAMADIMAGQRGLDHMLMAIADQADVPMRALEPHTTLFNLLGQDPLADQLDMLRLNLLARDLHEQMFVAMLDSYFAQEIGTLWELNRTAMMTIPDLPPQQALTMFDRMEEALLTIRNQNWLPVITGAAKADQSIVVAVGAAHLIGAEGVLQLLQDSGWTVAPLY